MSVALLAVIALVVAVAAFVQGSTGVGFALIVAPVVGLVEPALLPVFLLALMIPLNFYVAGRERGKLDWRGAKWITTGRFAGTFGGLWVLVAVPLAQLNLVVGASTVLAAVVTLLAPSFTPGRGAFLAAGAITGVTETATGVGGPPLALVYQHHPAAVLRSTVAVCFIAGEVISLVVLLATGKITLHALGMAAVLLPAVAVGALLSRFVHHRLDDRVMRLLVQLFAIVSGTVLLIAG
ncbi:sulfite exporter TauE/SafE family protein [Saccharopolyspora karakumensis]|uniref:Probable membrane transporter protein n=1 Tax=Saccharopolyspora karakumensis TaxID=2530386 RepID=A0A4R5BJA1_9PSEU|nr:sulfite exporter TauE/SafE family protein [Saccharopolyspora karakumensis]TDD85403.1 sulfite exporter TauE/SafE family protein [Saccharopolyspora karakumensis]